MHHAITQVLTSLFNIPFPSDAKVICLLLPALHFWWASTDWLPESRIFVTSLSLSLTCSFSRLQLISHSGTTVLSSEPRFPARRLCDRRYGNGGHRPISVNIHDTGLTVCRDNLLPSLPTQIPHWPPCSPTAPSKTYTQITTHIFLKPYDSTHPVQNHHLLTKTTRKIPPPKSLQPSSAICLTPDLGARHHHKV